GRTYLLNNYVRANNGVDDVTFRGCPGLTIEGNGAAISTRGDFFRDSRSTRGLAGLRFEDCSNVHVRSLQLIGNVQRMTRAAGLAEAATHGLIFGGCSDVTIDGVVARHFSADGLYIRASMAAVGGRYRASRRFTVKNSRFLFNARQGLSVIQLRDAVFDGCEFSFTGYIDAQSHAGAYGNHAPSAGVDVEPNATPSTARPVDVLTGNITFRNCRMAGNLGGALLAGNVRGTENTIENVIVQTCTIQSSEVSPLRYGMIFDAPGGAVTGCTFELGEKTIFIGWYPQSRASPTFSGNTVSGTGAGPARALLIVRPTRGAPVVEGNSFIVTGRAIRGPANPAQLVQIANPKAVVRDNQFAAER
ncbi:MAG TPA: right-handed parallel beta-helix repeat-containing protein, partial [Sphingomicrobium sp.]|nr:right-handed parallel beta-helix repeat-containing protein [Sphingomicrobium sp.]